MLSIHDYDRREQAAADELPNRVIEMVNPMTFASEGYPVRVRDERVLWRYVDVMHEGRFERDFVNLHDSGFTAREFDWLQRVAQLACRFSRDAFGRALTTRSSVSRSLHVFRAITDIVEEKPLRAFEIGPGSGYLGCLFIQNGWGYGATDIAQAFYLLQNRLWNHASDSKLIELASPDVAWNGEITPGHPVHVPWWEFYGFLEQRAPSVDIVTCNHALAEMHANSLAVTVNVAREMLRGDGPKYFVFEGWGFEKHQARDKVVDRFLRTGFSLVHTDDLITVFALQKNIAAPHSQIVPGGEIRPHVQIGRSLSLPGNTLTPRINDARAQRKTQLSIKLDRVNAFYRDLLGSDDLRTADERFLERIGRAY